MNAYNVELKNGKQLAIPAEYYPRFADIVATKENLFCLTPINRVEAFLKKIGHCIFNPTFAVLSFINLSLCAPILVTGYKGYQTESYYFYLSLGFISSYYITKIYLRLTDKQHLSIDGLAQQLGYKSLSSLLKPYDERMLKEIISLNNIKITTANLFFEDLYGIIFDQPTSRKRFHNCYATPHLKVIK